jgi:hypothetical protein
MANSEHPDGAGEVHRPFRCTFGPVREKDFLWPPPDEDVDAFTVVRLDGVDAPQPPSSPSRPAKANRPGRIIKPTFGDCRAPGLAPRVQPLVVPAIPPPLPPQPVAAADAPPSTEHPPERHGDAPPMELAAPITVDAADPEITTASRSAWIAVLFAAACAILAVFEYRIIVLEKAEAGLAVAEPPPLPQGVTPAELAPSVPRRVTPVAAPKPTPTPPAPAPPAAPAPSPTTTQPLRTPVPEAPVPKTQPLRTAPTQPARQAAPPPVQTSQPRPMAPPPQTPQPRPTAPPRVLVARAEAPAARDVPVAPVSGPSTVATSAAAPLSASAAAAPAPAPMTAAARMVDTPSARPVSAAVIAAVDTDEVDIRSALTRFRTAYSQLDARAARDVWPSVDARALERAFQSLKSQDLRFDRCDLTVNGTRAQASCRGRATYVPRIGDQSPRFTAREWTFELRKADERWTIASARTL